MHNASNLSDYDLKNLLDTLTKDDSTKSVILFASTLTAIAKYVERENINPTCEIASFITISEALEPWTKQIIEKRFKTPVFSRYSDQELGIMGQHIEAMSCPDCRNIVPLVVGGVIGDAAPSFNSLVGRLCLRCGSDRIHRWDMHTCPKCGGKMQPTGEEEFWT